MENSNHTEVVIQEIKGLKEFMEFRFNNLEKQGESFNDRINVLELWKANSLGKLAVISIAIGVFISMVSSYVMSHFR